MTEFQRPIVLGKILLAVLALSALLLLAARDIAPGVAGWRVLLYCAIGAGLCLLLLGFAALARSGFNRFMLNHGATDAQWMWWGGEPPGLSRLRGAAERAMHETPAESPSQQSPLSPDRRPPESSDRPQ